jgi:voltage-gated potassium channel
VRNFPTVPDRTIDQRLEGLRAVPLLAGVGDDGLRRILECATEFEAPPSQLIVEVRMPGNGLFLIEEGTVVVEVPGHPVELGPGQSFGELSLLTDKPRAARVRAKTAVRCLAISRSDFESILASEPTLAIAMLREIANRLVDSTTH